MFWTLYFFSIFSLLKTGASSYWQGHSCFRALVFNWGGHLCHVMKFVFIILALLDNLLCSLSFKLDIFKIICWLA